MVRCTKDNLASYRGSKPRWKCNFTMTVLTQSSSGQNKKSWGRISHLLSWRIFGRSFWCSWNSPRSMLPPSPEGGRRVPVSCAVACKINPGLDDRLFREKNNLDLGLGNVGKRKCRLLLWSVRPPWKGPAGTWINVKIFIGNSFDEYHVCGWPVKYFF